MKFKTISTILLSFVFLTSIAQTINYTDDGAYYFVANDWNGNGLQQGSHHVYVNPYLDKDFQNAVVINNHKETQRISLRYDMLRDAFEVEVLNGQNQTLDFQEDWDIMLHDKVYQYHKLPNNKDLEGYFEVVHTFEDGSKLVKKHLKEFCEFGTPLYRELKHKVHKLNDFIYHSRIYLLENNNLIELNNDKLVYKMLDKTYSKDLKNFITSNEVDFDKDYFGLVHVMAYYQKLKQIKPTQS